MDPFVFAILYCILLCVTYVTESADSDALLKGGWNVSNINKGYQKGRSNKQKGDSEHCYYA